METLAEKIARIQHDHNISLSEAGRVARAEFRMEDRKRFYAAKREETKEKTDDSN